MTFFEYKVVPAPKRLKRVRGVKTTADLFAAALSETINATARDGWEYVRAESLPAMEEGGWFRRAVEVVEAVLVFRRPRETLGPRLPSARPEAAEAAIEPETVRRVAERSASARERAPDRAPPTAARREPRLGDGPEHPRPLRPAPRLGPADKS